MEYGRKAASGAAEKVVRKVSLDADEMPLFFGTCSNWMPVALDWLLVTNKRLLAGQSVPVKINWEAARSEITSVASSGGASTLTVVVGSGESLTVKKVPFEDHGVILGALGLASKVAVQDPIDAVPDTLTQAPNPAAVVALKPQASWTERLKALGEKAGEEWKEAVSDPAPKGHDPELHGRLFRKVQVGMKNLEIYERGFVRNGGIFVGSSSIEPIVSVKYRETTTAVAQDQSVVGSFVTNTVSLGMMSTENVKRKTSGTITITTEENIYTGAVNARIGRMIEALAERAVSSPQRGPEPGAVVAPSVPDLADQIKKLAELHAAGILTDDEFSAKKSELLDRM